MAFTPIRKNFVGLAAATSANGTTRSGAALQTDQIGEDGLSVLIVCDLTTASVTGTFTPQVSDDNSTWYNWKEPQAPAQVVHATGTGSQVVTRTALIIDASVKAWRYFRCNALLGGATTAAADQTTVTYKFADGFSV